MFSLYYCICIDFRKVVTHAMQLSNLIYLLQNFSTGKFFYQPIWHFQENKLIKIYPLTGGTVDGIVLFSDETTTSSSVLSLPTTLPATLLSILPLISFWLSWRSNLACLAEVGITMSSSLESKVRKSQNGWSKTAKYLHWLVETIITFIFNWFLQNQLDFWKKFINATSLSTTENAQNCQFPSIQ